MKDLIEYIDELEDIMPQRVRAVYIYGSGARNLNKENLTNLDLVVVVDDLNGEDIFLCSKASNKWARKKKNKTPIFLDYEEWMSTADIYPLEYSEMKDCSFKVRGENILSELKINKFDLKTQCKQEARKFLMRCRNLYIQTAHLNYDLSNSLCDLVSLFMVIFRTVLRLSRIEVPKDDREIIFIVCELAKLAPEQFIYSLHCKNTNCKLAKNKAVVLLSELHDETTKLLEYIEQL